MYIMNGKKESEVWVCIGGGREGVLVKMNGRSRMTTEVGGGYSVMGIHGEGRRGGARGVGVLICCLPWLFDH